MVIRSQGMASRNREFMRTGKTIRRLLLAATSSSMRRRRVLPLRSNTRPNSNIRPSSSPKPHSGIRPLPSKPLLQDLRRQLRDNLPCGPDSTFPVKPRLPPRMIFLLEP